MPTQPASPGAPILARADVLAAISEDAPRLTRVFLSKEHRLAAAQLVQWMQAAGMHAHIDAIGNVIGRYEGQHPNAPALLVGSHMDSVRDAGRYDGIFGILCPIACVERLHHSDTRLPFAIEVIAFADEEGVRFGATLLGSHALAGSFDLAWLDKRDANGCSMREALRAFGGDPNAITSLARDPAATLGFIEVHIEQGPVLLSEDRALGVVSAIAASTRFQMGVEGLAGHAGTVPMGLRQDALAASAEMLLAIERIAQTRADTVATVGRIEAQPGAINVIPGQVAFTLDARAPSNTLRDQLCAELQSACSAIAQRRGVRLTAHVLQQLNAATCAPHLMQQLETSLTRCALPTRILPSGAGHDAMVMGALTDMAMLFVRCGNGGISHHSDEIMTAEDAALATDVLHDFILHFQPRST